MNTNIPTGTAQRQAEFIEELEERLAELKTEQGGDQTTQGDLAQPYQGVKRITVEVTPALHLKIKTYCVANGKNIADEVRAMLMERFK